MQIGDLPSGDEIRTALGELESRVAERDRLESENASDVAVGASSSSLLESSMISSSGKPPSVLSSNEFTTTSMNISTTNVPVPSAAQSAAREPMPGVRGPSDISRESGYMISATGSSRLSDDSNLRISSEFSGENRGLSSETNVNIKNPSANNADLRLEDIELMIDSDYAGVLQPSVESAIKKKWSRVIGQEFDIVVSINLFHFEFFE